MQGYETNYHTLCFLVHLIYPSDHFIASQKGHSYYNLFPTGKKTYRFLCDAIYFINTNFKIHDMFTFYIQTQLHTKKSAHAFQTQYIIYITMMYYSTTYFIAVISVLRGIDMKM